VAAERPLPPRDFPSASDGFWGCPTAGSSDSVYIDGRLGYNSAM
jgi:hypothetical protein